MLLLSVVVVSCFDNRFHITFACKPSVQTIEFVPQDISAFEKEVVDYYRGGYFIKTVSDLSMLTIK